MEKNNRNIGIDILKFIAVLFITNSHMDTLYGDYSIMATGGTVGDVLFFFVSGFTLFLKPMTNIREFPNWYKRRINRIYPTVLAVAIITCLLFHERHDIIHIILYGGGWFISCIMIYYVFIFFIGLYFRKRTTWIIIGVSVASCIWYISIEREFPFNMYGYGYLKWLLYFNFMLLGAMIGGKGVKGGSNKDLLIAILCLAGFYALYVFPMRIERIEFWEITNFIPLLISVYYLYRWSNSPTAKIIYYNKTGNYIIRFIGGLCLEIYLIQGYIFTDKLNGIFPLNILIVFTAIVIGAYLTRCLSRIISQTFKDAPYDWKAIVKAY